MYDILYQLADPLGIVGVIIVLIAYFMLSIESWPVNSVRYQLLNFLGAWLILYSLYFHWNLASALIEIAWIFISLIGFYKIAKK